jgi:hypothetical protein
MSSVSGLTLVNRETHQAADQFRTELTATAMQMMQQHAQQVLRDIANVADDVMFKDLMDLVDETQNFKKHPDWRHPCQRK